MAEKKFSDIGRVAAIEYLFEGTAYKPWQSLYFETASKAYVTNKTSLFLEGVDFDLVYFPLKHLGYKCAIASTAKLYAELSHPRTMDVKIGVSSKLDLEQIKELWQGIVTAAKEHGYSAMNLDLVPSKNGLAISLSVSGETSINVKRPKAESKDLICISGSVGGAYFGQTILERGKHNFDAEGTQPQLEKYKMMLASYLKPEITPNLPLLLEDSGIIPSSGYIVDRGLSDTIQSLGRDTGLGAKIYANKIPFEGNSFELGKQFNIDPVSAAMNGGDDYRILFTVPLSSFEKFRHDFQAFDIIGHLAQPEVGAVLVTPDGAELPLKSQGWIETE